MMQDFSPDDFARLDWLKVAAVVGKDTVGCGAGTLGLLGKPYGFEDIPNARTDGARCVPAPHSSYCSKYSG